MKKSKFVKYALNNWAIKKQAEYEPIVIERKIYCIYCYDTCIGCKRMFATILGLADEHCLECNKARLKDEVEKEIIPSF
jgi:hypothetical protein